VKPGNRARPWSRRAGAAFVVVAASSLLAAACASSGAMNEKSSVPVGSGTKPDPDPRIGLKAGLTDAGEASWNMRLVSNTMSPPNFAGVTNSDLAFRGNYAIQGNYNGFVVWDISNARKPNVVNAFLCPASQSDVSVYGNLLFVSAEGLTGRKDCGTQGVPDTVSHERVRGLRIFEATDLKNPKYITNVQTCRGSHTHTVVSDPKDSENVYVYISGSARVRSPNELPGCLDAPIEDPTSARFRIEVIQIPLKAPEQAKIVSSPRIFDGLDAPPRHSEPDARPRPANANRQGPPPARRGGPNQCHDITVYPAIGLAGGACEGYGLLLDIRDVKNPIRLAAVADSNFSYWHSATFSNDGSKVLFTDEWGGGSAPRCRATDKYEWGANAIFTIRGRELDFKSYYKMPAPQTQLENCVAHNGSLIPIPGREVMVQAWYQGGISVFDWTDPSKPHEIAFFDRGPVSADSTRRTSGGSWSVYWYNGKIVSSEIARGLDIFELTPSELLSQNEIDAANTVRFEELNAQEQPKIVWPASFALARAYLDQLERNDGLGAERIASARMELARAEKLSGQQRVETLGQLATRLHEQARGAADEAKVHTLATAVGDLASAQR